MISKMYYKIKCELGNEYRGYDFDRMLFDSEELALYKVEKLRNGLASWDDPYSFFKVEEFKVVVAETLDDVDKTKMCEGLYNVTECFNQEPDPLSYVNCIKELRETTGISFTEAEKLYNTTKILFDHFNRLENK